MTPDRYLRLTTPDKLPKNAPEGLRAAWWRERVLKMSRPELAKQLGMTPLAIFNIETSQTAKVRDTYRLALAALSIGIMFDWKNIRIARADVLLDN